MLLSLTRVDQADDGYAGAHGGDIDHEALERGIAAGGISVLKCEENQQKDQREAQFFDVQEGVFRFFGIRFNWLVHGHGHRIWKKPNQSE